MRSSTSVSSIRYAPIVSVEDYPFAVSQVAQTSLRSIIGKSDLDDLLTNRERLNQGLELMLDNPAVEWGIHIDRVEIKDVALPETMKRSMSRQAEAERERRARVISAEGELQASDRLAQAAAAMADTPGALQLRLLETIVAGGFREELHPRAALPGRVATVPGEQHQREYGSIRCSDSCRTRPALSLKASASPDNKDRLTSAPEVAALEAREPEQQDRPTVRAANRLSPVRQSRPPAKDAG